MTTRREPDAIRWLEHGAAPGARNMALDHALMPSARRGEVTLRVYGWEPPCVSVGRNQRVREMYSRESADRLGVDVVRRPTGGRSVFHHREVTYALAAPADLWGGLRESYSRVNGALRRGLVRLGAPAEVSGNRDDGRAPGPGPRACFRDPLPGEVTAGGRKLVGSAQWREGGALLQQGSLLMADDQSVVAELRADDAEEPPAGGAASLDEFLDPVPSFERVAAALRSGFREEFGLEPDPGRLGDAERERASDLRERYRDDGWTWRR